MATATQKANATKDALTAATGRGAPTPTAPAPKATGERADYELDQRTGAKVIDSLVLRGDLSGLGPAERARFYVQMCEGLGLNPHAQPFAFLRLNGKEILYATRGATDQLAAMHRVTREIIDGPKVIDLGGTKLVYAVCKASMPNGRYETSTATVPLIDPVNVLMKAETKAKRRATLSLLGLGLLDEIEIETIPAGAQEPGGGLDLNQGAGREEDSTQEPAEDDVPTELAGFYAGLPEVTSAEECITLWTGRHYHALLAATPRDRDVARERLLKKLRQVGGESLASKGRATTWFDREVERALSKPGGQGEQGAPDDSTPLGGFYARVGEIELPGEAVAVWMKYRAELAPLPVADREAAWRSLCKRTEEVGRMKNAKVWLKKAIAEEDARKGNAGAADAQAC